MSLTNRRQLFGATIAIAMVVAVGWPNAQKKDRTRTLPDGSKLVLQEVTYDEPYTLRSNNRWRDYLVPLIPMRWAKKLGCHFMTEGASDTLTFWLRSDKILVTRTRPGVLRAVTFDEHGCEFSATHACFQPPLQLPQLIVFNFSTFPRRSKTVGLRVFEQRTNGTWSVLAEYSVPNPAPRSYPHWKPELPPVTRSVGQTNFSLLEMKFGVQAKALPLRPVAPGEATGSYLKFRITENGRPSPSQWIPERITILDALGHQTAQGGHAMAILPNGDYLMNVMTEICSEESAWRVKAEFARRPPFTDREVWRVTSVPVPTDESTAKVSAVTSIDGARLHFAGLMTKKQLERDRRRFDSWPQAHVIVTGLTEQHHFQLVEILDDQGRDVRGRFTSGDHKHTNWFFSLNLKPDSKHVDLTFAVSRRISLEYFVKPSRLTADELKRLK